MPTNPTWDETEEYVPSWDETTQDQPQPPALDFPQALITPEKGGVPISPEQVRADLLAIEQSKKQQQIRDTLGYPELEPKATAGTGFREEVGERFDAYGRGLLNIVPSTLKTAATVLPNLASGGPVTDPLLPGWLKPHLEIPELYQAGKATEQFIGQTFPRPEVEDLGHQVMEGFGQAGPTLGAGAAVRMAGGGLAAATTAASGLGAVMEFDDAFERSVQHGDDKDTAFAKSLGYATAAALIENRLGAGRILRQIFPNAVDAAKKLTAMGVSKNLIGNFISGGVEEGAQRFAQNWIVEEKPSMEGVVEEALPGSIVQGVLGLPGAAVTPPVDRRRDEGLERAIKEFNQRQNVPTTPAPAATTTPAAAPPTEQPKTEPSPGIITEKSLETMTPAEIGKLGHTPGMQYGVTLTDADVPRLEAKYKEAAEHMQAAVKSAMTAFAAREKASAAGDTAAISKADHEYADAQVKQSEAFGRYNFFGGALQGVTGGKHKAAATNYASYLRDTLGLQERGTITVNDQTVYQFHDPVSGSAIGITEGTKYADAKAKVEKTRKAFEKSSTEVETETEPVVAEERIPGSEQPDVFSMDDADLENFVTSSFKEPAVETGQEARAPQFAFPTYDAFKAWMDARYAERDLEGMKLAFADADTATKVRFIKENRASPDHKRSWIANMATGAPLPTTDPPVTRTTPRPGPSGRTTSTGPRPTPRQPQPQPQPSPPPPGQPPPRQQPPPPTPRQPTNRSKFDIMALVQLFRQFSKFPVVNERLMRAYGRFVPGTQAVELKSRLMWDTKLAERVLGHEIGHFLDFIIKEVGKGKMLAQRLRPLYDFRGRMYQAQDLRDEARRLSRAWRGNFQNGDRYRDTANELFADFMSAMFNSPEWVNQNFPTLFDAFQEVLDSKPQFKSAYREIETWLQGGTMAREFIDQQETSVERTINELENPKKPSRASILDRIRFATMSLWHRAFQKEGKPRELGQSIADELEYSKTWAAKEDALMADDFIKTVDSELRKVADDPVKARALLTAYSQAVRTIGERRAAGKWIETHPDEARSILQRILAIDPTLRSKWSQQLSTATNDQLYDLSAAIFRDIHDHDSKFVNRMIKAIDDLNLGVDGEAALMAFNVRGKLLNPGGLTPENASAVIDELKTQLGSARFNALETAAKNLRDMMFRTQEAMHNEGLISDKTWNELILPNRDNYVPYAVLDYFDGKVRAGVMPQKGTAKDIADVSAAVQLKIASANSWRQKQRQVQLIRDAYAKGGVTIPIGEELKRASDLEQIQRKNQSDDVSRAVLWSDGKPHLVEFTADPGKMLERALDAPAFYEHMQWVGEASDLTHRVMQLYTQFSIPFLFWRNPVRGARTAALKVGFLRAGQQLTPKQLASNLRLARNYARAAFGGEMLPEVRELVDRQILLPPRLSQSMVRDADTLRRLIEHNLILANQVRRAHVGRPAWWKGGDIGRGAIILSEKLFTTYEAFEKIYNYQAALAKGLTPAQAGAIARRGGIPKPGVGGKWSLAMEVWFPWTRVHLQGMRSTFDMLMDPRLGKPFATRFLLTEALPRIAKAGIAAGVVAGAIKWAIGDDEDEDDGVMAEFMRRVSPYKMALDDTVPLYFYDPRTGKVHYLWEYKKGGDVPKHYEAVSLRIPSSEEGRLWGVLLYNMMTAAPGAYEKAGKPGRGFTESAGQWAANYLGPGLSPIIETTDNLKDMILLGKNPEDPYRGVPSANPMMFEAGGTQRAEAIAGYVMNQLGSPGELAGVMAANFGLLDKRALNAMSNRLPSDYKTWNESLPFLKTAVSHDNYGQFREEKIAELEEAKLRANARLLIPEAPRALYDFYYRNIQRKDKLTDSESEQFDIAREFVTQVWGTLTIDGEPNPDSFYGKAAHAVGKDGSREAKETFKRDITDAAAPYIAAFAEARKAAQ